METKLFGCWQLKDKKNSPSTINNHLLELIGVTVQYIYRKLLHYYLDILFNVQTAYSSTRERKSVRVYEQTHKEASLSRPNQHLTPNELSEHHLLTDNFLKIR